MPDDSFDPSLALVGRFVELRPLERRHAPELIRWLRDGTVLQFFRAPPGTTDRGISAWIDATIEGGRSGTNRPLTTVLRSTGTPVGMTQFLRIDRPNRGVEIGSTWVAPPFWRTPVNTEAKLLMLRHAFDHAHFHRVQIQTDLRNARSQRAIEGLGSVAEARLREDVALPDGSYRTSVYYSILEDEWRAVRTHLETRLDRPWNPPTEPPPLSADADGGGRPDGTPSPPSAPLQFRPPFTLTGPHVRLVPLVRADLPELTAAGSAPEIWSLLRIQHGDTPEGMAALVDDLLTLQAAGEVIPFTVRWGREGRIVGVARYLDIDRANRWVELGTWLHPSVWRTPVNTELKLLLLRHAFDVEKVHRVQLKTDDRNGRSIRAIERLGAVYEGERRDHYRFPDGRYRTSKYFSILEGEWPTVREHLQAFLKRPWPDLANTP